MNEPTNLVNGQSNLGWLLTSFARRVPSVTYALAVSVDGLTMAASDGLGQDRADQLSAITSGLASLTLGTSRCLDSGRVRQFVVDMDGGVLLVMAVAERGQLAVFAEPGCDLGQVGYESALLVQKVSTVLEPAARVLDQR